MNGCKYCILAAMDPAKLITPAGRHEVQTPSSKLWQELHQQKHWVPKILVARVVLGDGGHTLPGRGQCDVAANTVNCCPTGSVTLCDRSRTCNGSLVDLTPSYPPLFPWCCTAPTASQDFRARNRR